jgi:Xaa-Pro aminopeptidase
MLLKEKVAQARTLLEELGIDCWITFVRETQINGDPVLVFLSPGQLTWHSALIVPRSGPTRAIVGRYDFRTVQESGAWDDVVGFVTSVREPLLAALKAIEPQTIAVNYSEDSEICDGITHGMFLTLQRLLGEIGMADRIVSAERLVSALRERKTPFEIDRVRAAIGHTEAIFELVGGFMRQGQTEKEIAAFMKAEVARRGLSLAWEEASCPAVFSGPAGAEAHYAPTDTRVAAGHVLSMDFGVRVDGYCSDMQRAFYAPVPGENAPPAAVVHGFETIVHAIQAAKDAIRPGVEGREVDAVARKIIVEAGYEEFPHGLGHQVGRFSHDGTALLGPTWEKYAGKPYRPLEVGMVFTIEPRLPVAGHGICTIEEMVVVTEHGCDWLSHPQLEIGLIR